MYLIRILGAARVYALCRRLLEKLRARNLSISVKPQVVNSLHYLHMPFHERLTLQRANLLRLMGSCLMVSEKRLVALFYLIIRVLI